LESFGFLVARCRLSSLLSACGPAHLGQARRRRMRRRRRRGGEEE
jgi:hypothetical protein